MDSSLPPELGDLDEESSQDRLRVSGVPHDWSWETLREWRAGSVTPEGLRAWVRREVPARWGVVLAGPPGLGKTGAAC